MNPLIKLPQLQGLSEKVIQAAWLDGCRSGAIVAAIALIVLYLWKKT